MREILFRGKRADNGEWVEGFLVKKIDPLFSVESWFILVQKYDTSCIDGKPTILESLMTWYKVSPETVSESTSLSDKNSKKIFEGDIIHSVYANCRINEHIEKVVFHDGRFMAENVEGGFFAKISGKDSPKHLSQDTSVYMIECEVIGNIHDNPELLKEGAE